MPETLPLIGFGPAIPDAKEFNRRARIALRAVDHDSRFLTDMSAKIDRGESLNDNQQRAFFKTVYSLRRHIHDEALLEYAATKAKGY